MAGYRLNSIAELARQLAFAPVGVRAGQLENAEELLLEIEPNKGYPVEFVVYRVTGFRDRKAAVEGELLTGMALQHDLGLLIESVSDSLDVAVGSLGEPVLTIEDVSERFGVATKTIQRWRRKGLPARRYVFEGGKRRVGFLVRSVERYMAGHSEEVGSGEETKKFESVKFGALATDEPGEMVRMARRLCGYTTQGEMCRRIGKKMGRAALTVLHTLRGTAKGLAALNEAIPEITEEMRPRVYRAWKKGASLKELGRELSVPNGVVYRAIVDERVERLNRRKHHFVEDALYREPDALEVLTALVKAEELPPPRTTGERMPKDLPAYFQALYRTPLLTPGRERALFLLFNYHKYLFVTARKGLDGASARSRQIAVLEKHLKDATGVKNAIVAANLRLVVAVARKHLRPSLDLMELVSDGNLTLMRAVESFDTKKGNKFSTYATLALMKGFARSVPLMLAAKAKAGRGEEMLTGVADGRETEHHRVAVLDQLKALMHHLSPVERGALLARFGVGEESALRRGLEVGGARNKGAEARALEKLKAITQCQG